MSKHLRLVTSASQVPVDEVNPVPPYSVWYDGEKVYFFPKHEDTDIVTYTTTDGNILGIKKSHTLFIEAYENGSSSGKYFVGEKYVGNQGYLIVSPAWRKGIVGVYSQAFEDIQNLKSIDLPNSIIKIELRAFLNCVSLQSIVMPQKLRRIEQDAFRRCVSLTNVVFNEGLEFIGRTAFSECSQLRKIILPNSLKTLGAAFSECSQLQDVTLPNSIKVIQSFAFNACDSLESIILPLSIEKIEDHAFSWNHHFKSVWYDNIEYRSKAALKGALLANGVELGTDPFYDTALTP